LREIDLDEGIASALDALFADRLAILCGAGLSMASPSNLPSAAQLASQAKRKYDSIYGATRAPLPPSIEEQAEFFFKRGELGTMYLRALIDAHAFAGPPMRVTPRLQTYSWCAQSRQRSRRMWTR
jgi:hypothetical protein